MIDFTDATAFGLGGTVKTFTINNATTTFSKVFTSTTTGNGLTKEVSTGKHSC